MCITLPTKVLSVDGSTATVECLGETRRVLLPFFSVKSGDWVLLYAGAVVSVVTEEQARDHLAFMNIEPGA